MDFQFWCSNVVFNSFRSYYISGVMKLGILILIIFFSCSQNEKYTKDPPISEQTSKMLVDIQLKIDSAESLYDQAIKEIEHGISPQIVKEHYELKAARLHQYAKVNLDNITKEYMQKKATKDEYEKILKKIDLTKMIQKTSLLHEKGIDFNLKRTD
jgi:hypothetical protein